MPLQVYKERRKKKKDNNLETNLFKTTHILEWSTITMQGKSDDFFLIHNILKKECPEWSDKLKNVILDVVAIVISLVSFTATRFVKWKGKKKVSTF